MKKALVVLSCPFLLFCNSSSPTDVNDQIPINSPHQKSEVISILPSNGDETTQEPRWEVSIDWSAAWVKFVGRGTGSGCFVYNGPGRANWNNPVSTNCRYEFKKGETFQVRTPGEVCGGSYQVDWRTVQGDILSKIITAKPCIEPTPRPTPSPEPSPSPTPKCWDHGGPNKC